MTSVSAVTIQKPKRTKLLNNTPDYASSLADYAIFMAIVSRRIRRS